MYIEHIAMYVNDLEKTKEFFIKYLGAKSNNVYHNKKTDFKSYFLILLQDFHFHSYILLIEFLFLHNTFLQILWLSFKNSPS